MQSYGFKNDDNVLEVNNLCTQFKLESGIVSAVDNISLTLGRGETIGIVGESGSGKSVTALSILQLINYPGKITNGNILFNSPKWGKIDLANTTEKIIHDIRGNEISMVFQEPMSSLNPVLTCGYQVSEVLKLHLKLNNAEAFSRTIELFEKVKLPRSKDIFHSYPHQLSGGQKQRVMIAMALCCNPSVLIADEPTTALDVTVQATILQLLKTLKDEFNTSIIFITHDLGVVADIADRVLVMYHGKIVEENNVWELFSKPKHAYTKGLLACRPKFEVKLKVLPVLTDFVENDTEGNLIEKKSIKYESLGEALLMNYVTSEEIGSRLNVLLSRPSLLSVKNLKVYYQKQGIFKKNEELVKAVDDVSFDVYPGETLGLVGESGCGKTTLGRAILKLILPTSGSINFDAKPLDCIKGKELRELRKDIQIIFQDPYSSLNPRITVGSALKEPMRVHRILDSDNDRKQKVMELLEIVGLKKEHYHRYPHEFSGGQRQRLCIARTLSLNPKFIVCDESVSALDVSVQAQILNLLNSLKERFGFTYIFISHNLAVVKFMSDRIMVMKNGKIEELDAAESIYENPKTEYTKRLISSIPKGELSDLRFRKYYN